MVLLFVAQIAIAIIAGIFGNIDRNAIFSMHWITYFCPIVRLIDFYLAVVWDICS